MNLVTGLHSHTPKAERTKRRTRETQYRSETLAPCLTTCRMVNEKSWRNIHVFDEWQIKKRLNSSFCNDFQYFLVTNIPCITLNVVLKLIMLWKYTCSLIDFFFNLLISSIQLFYRSPGVFRIIGPGTIWKKIMYFFFKSIF